MYYNEKYDIFIEAGQSNAEGTGLGNTIEPYEPTPDIMYMTDNRDYLSFGEGEVKIKPGDKENSIHIAKEHLVENNLYGDFALTFAKDYIKNGYLKDGRKVLIVRTASGGTGFESGQWKTTDYLYKRMLALVDFALSLNPENKIIGLLWHQGENDARHDAKIYGERLTALLKGIRAKYGQSLPFIAGDFVYDWKSKNMDVCEPIINEIKKVIKNNQPAEFVETADLLSNNQILCNGDIVHFCKDSLYRLGHRYFDAFQKIYNK